MAGKAGTGGSATHKNPDCRCPPCTARRRKAEAILSRDRDGGGSVAPTPAKATTLSQINADFPLIAPKGGVGSAHKERVLKWMQLRADEPEMTTVEAARRMGIAKSTLHSSLSIAVKEGWLRFDDPIARLEHEIIPRAIDNLSVLLKDNDKTATLETLKGTSFPAYREAKGISDAPKTILALKIEAADPENTKIIAGTVVGKPKELK